MTGLLPAHSEFGRVDVEEIGKGTFFAACCAVCGVAGGRASVEVCSVEVLDVDRVDRGIVRVDSEGEREDRRRGIVEPGPFYRVERGGGRGDTRWHHAGIQAEVYAVSV